MLNNFTPTDRQLKLAKVMESPDLRAILKKMESGAVIWKTEFGAVYLKERSGHTRLSVRQFRTLFNAGLLSTDVETDDYFEYRLTYTGTFEELVRGGKE